MNFKKWRYFIIRFRMRIFDIYFYRVKPFCIFFAKENFAKQNFIQFLFKYFS